MGKKGAGYSFCVWWLRYRDKRRLLNKSSQQPLSLAYVLENLLSVLTPLSAWGRSKRHLLITCKTGRSKDEMDPKVTVSDINCKLKSHWRQDRFNPSSQPLCLNLQVKFFALMKNQRRNVMHIVKCQVFKNILAS